MAIYDFKVIKVEYYKGGFFIPTKKTFLNLLSKKDIQNDEKYIKIYHRYLAIARKVKTDYEVWSIKKIWSCLVYYQNNIEYYGEYNGGL